MAKRKDAIALFEVMRTANQKSRPSAPVPLWLKKQQAQAAAQEPLADAVADDQAVPVVQAPRAANAAQEAMAISSDEAAAQPAEPAKQPETPEPTVLPVAAKAVRPSGKALSGWFSAGLPIFAREGSGFVLRLSQAGWLVVAAAAVLVIAGAFFGGRWTARLAGTQLAGSGLHDPLEGSLGGQGAGQAPLGNPPALKREADKDYLVIKEMPGSSEEHLKEARAFLKFLEDNNELATVNQYSSGSRNYFIWSLRGFASQHDKDEFVKKIESLPKAASYGLRYKGQPIFLKGSRDKSAGE